MEFKLIDCMAPESTYHKLAWTGPLDDFTVGLALTICKYHPCVSRTVVMFDPTVWFTSSACAGVMSPGPKAPKVSAALITGWMICSMIVEPALVNGMEL